MRPFLRRAGRFALSVLALYATLLFVLIASAGLAAYTVAAAGYEALTGKRDAVPAEIIAFVKAHTDL